MSDATDNRFYREKQEQLPSKTAICIAMLALAGCDPVTRTSSPDFVSDAAKDITYFKDIQRDICFAMIQSTSYGLYNIVSLATVPCEKVGL